MRYGFTSDGGFVVADDAKRIGEFAFATSTYATQARRDPDKVANTMLAKHWPECPGDIREAHYVLSCDQLDSATRWPV